MPGPGAKPCRLALHLRLRNSTRSPALDQIAKTPSAGPDRVSSFRLRSATLQLVLVLLSSPSVSSLNKGFSFSTRCFRQNRGDLRPRIFLGNRRPITQSPPDFGSAQSQMVLGRMRAGTPAGHRSATAAVEDFIE